MSSPHIRVTHIPGSPHTILTGKICVCMCMCVCAHVWPSFSQLFSADISHSKPHSLLFSLWSLSPRSGFCYHIQMEDSPVTVPSADTFSEAQTNADLCAGCGPLGCRVHTAILVFPKPNSAYSSPNFFFFFSSQTQLLELPSTHASNYLSYSFLTTEILKLCL